MSNVSIYNQDNIEFLNNKIECYDLIYADMMYDDLNFDWIDFCHKSLKSTGSIFVQSDYRSVAELKIYMDSVFGSQNFVNWIVWSYDWGGRSKRSFGRKHDDILWYSKTKDYKFYPDAISILKKTANASGFNPSGRTHKIPTDVWEGNFHTMDKERVKYEGKNFRWQKPEWIIERIVKATTLEGDTVFDPFLGSGTTGKVCKRLGRHFYGTEILPEVFELAKKELDNEY